MPPTDETEDDEALKNRRSILAHVNALRLFATTFRSRMRQVEVYNEGGVLRECDKEIVKAQETRDYYQKLLDGRIARKQERLKEIVTIREWLAANQDKFDTFEGMLSDEAENLVKKLNRLV